MEKEEATKGYFRAKELISEECYAEGLAILERLNRYFPNQRRVTYRRAVCYAALAQFDDATILCSLILGKFKDRRVEDLIEWIREQKRSAPPHDRTPPPFETVRAGR